MSKKYTPRLTSRFQRKTPLIEKSSPLEQSLELVVEHLDHQGCGRVKVAGESVPIASTLPGERVLVEVVQDDGAATLAKLVSVVEPSGYRVEPPCPHFEVCGGCSLQHCQPEQQLRYKAEQLEQAVLALQAPNKKAFPKLGSKPNKKKPSFSMAKVKMSHLAATPLAYRRRARLGVSVDGQLGFRQTSSNTTCAIEQCLVLTQPLQALLQSLNGWLKCSPQSQPWAEIVGHIELIDAEPRPAAIIRQTEEVSAAAVEALQTLAAKQNFDVLWQRDKASDQSNTASFSYPLASGIELGFGVGDFIQVNAGVNQLMIDQATEWLGMTGEETLLDLFCGVGNFSLPLAKQCKAVIGVEVSANMVEKAAANAERNGIENVRFMEADLEQDGAVERFAGNQVDRIILDPPRAGAAGIIPRLVKLNAKRIVYVSCNPGTLVRDSKVLLAAGYRFSRLSAMDMFPNTSHVEAMALFERL